MQMLFRQLTALSRFVNLGLCVCYGIEDEGACHLRSLVAFTELCLVVNMGLQTQALRSFHH